MFFACCGLSEADRYWGCPQCGALWATTAHCPGTSFRGAICDFTHIELEEVTEEERDAAGRPDADHDEVVVMLDDPGLVDFVDPVDLEGLAVQVF